MAQLHGPRQVPSRWVQKGAFSDTDSSTKVRLTVSLYRRNALALDTLFWAVSNPMNQTMYGKHLSTEEMRTLVGATKETRTQVEAWLLSSSGKNDVELQWSPHGDAVAVWAPIRIVEALLQTKFYLFTEVATGRRLHRAPGATFIPQSLLSVVEVVSGHGGFPGAERANAHVTGNYQRESAYYSSSSSSTYPASSSSTGGSASSNTGTNGIPNVTPATIYATYNITQFPTMPLANRTSYVQSFFQSQGQYTNETELSMFCQYILAPGLTPLDPSMTPDVIASRCGIREFIGNNSDVSPGTNGESSLDSQYLLSTSALAPTFTYSYLDVDFCGDLLHWAVDVFDETRNGGVYPRVISMSYGSQQAPNYCLGPEVERLSRDIQQMGALGISVLIASGDDGSGEYYNHGSAYNNGILSPSFPASIPYCTAVGATTFVPGTSQQEEMATTQFGSGGGFSYDYGIPLYQSESIREYFHRVKTLPPSNTYNATGRGTPDVAALGEGFHVVTNGTVQIIGGTSASTPTFSGFVTLLNTVRLQQGKSTLGFLNLMFYHHPELFQDVTKGSNDVMGDGNGFQTAVGWDPVTGLGTPNVGAMLAFVAALP